MTRRPEPQDLALYRDLRARVDRLLVHEHPTRPIVRTYLSSLWEGFADGTQVMGVDIDPDYSGVIAWPTVTFTFSAVTMFSGLFPTVAAGSYTASWHVEFERTAGTQDADGLIQIIGTGSPIVADFYDLGPEGTWDGSVSFTAVEDDTFVNVYLYGDADETDPADSSWLIGSGSWLRITPA